MSIRSNIGLCVKNVNLFMSMFLYHSQNDLAYRLPQKYENPNFVQLSIYRTTILLRYPMKSQI